MNELILIKLAEQSGLLNDVTILEALVELVVRECATIVEDSKWNLPRNHKAIDQANLIKQHFGIE